MTNLAAALDYYKNRLGFRVDWGGSDGGISGISQRRCRLFLTDRACREHCDNLPPVVIWLNVLS